jgi:hypothetical protein
MDDFLLIRFALDNVHPPSLGECARAAFDRMINGEAVADTDSRDGKSYARLRDSGMAGRLGGALTDKPVTYQRPSSIGLARGQHDGSLDGAILFRKQKEAARSL